MSAHLDVDSLQVEQQTTICPACREQVFAARGEGFCRECFITFRVPRVSRAEVLKQFSTTFFMSKNGTFYHRSGCKYLKSISPENLIEIAEPFGKPCRCIRS